VASEPSEGLSVGEEAKSRSTWTQKIVDKQFFYQGEINKRGERHGFGVLRNCDFKVVYRGDWLNDIYDGNGTLYNEEPTALKGRFDYRDFSKVKTNWLRYEGAFHRGTLNGQGILELSNGERLEANFLEGRVHG
jgi:hypothetical protein